MNSLKLNMRVNYHTHTYRCKHASGTEEEYIKVAISRGVEKLGFSDHAPFDYGDFVSGCRMSCSQIDEYFDTLLNLKHKYRDYIDMFIGFEIEYSRLFDTTVASYKKYPLDYLLLGQHYVGLECDMDVTNSFLNASASTLAKYVDECIKGINTGIITYLAHPDCINYLGDDEVYDYEMSRLISALNSKNIPLEINLLGIRRGRNYPSEKFFRLAKGTGAKVILGCDAHAPLEVADSGEIEIAYRIADKYGLEVLQDCTLINPFANKE